MAVGSNQGFQGRSIDLRLGGRYALASRYDAQGNRREFACRTTRISPLQMLVSVPVLGPVGERVISYFGDFGSLEGWIVDLAEGGFLLNIELPRQRREKFAAKLTWLKQQENKRVIDVRQQKRIVPQNPHSTLIFANGRTLNCLVIDISPSGVAVSADADPEIGTRLAVGQIVGHVVRRFAEGFAVQFDRLHEMENLERVICPPKDFSAYLERADAVASSMVPVPARTPRGAEQWYVD
jgi:hypothetical protein